jgi:menaquinone-dependent protoporphyrinogen IX oxidase
VQLSGSSSEKVQCHLQQMKRTPACTLLICLHRQLKQKAESDVKVRRKVKEEEELATCCKVCGGSFYLSW